MARGPTCILRGSFGHQPWLRSSFSHLAAARRFFCALHAALTGLVGSAGAVPVRSFSTEASTASIAGAVASSALPGIGAAAGGTANSYIGMGAFETMGTDVGRAATGLAYLEETVRVQDCQYEEEVNPRKRSARGISLAQSLLQVGRQHHQQQDPQEAIRHYQRAQNLIEAGLTARVNEDTDSAKRMVAYARFMLSEILSGLGVAYNDLGQHEEALDAMQKAFALRKETVGKGHASLAECLNNLGALFFGRGSLQRSVEHYEQALELLTAAAGGRQEGPHVALTLYNIGVCWQGLGQLPQAMAALQKALELAEQSFGYDHPQVALIKSTIAKGGRAQGQRAGT
eukprot:CAMPEP_0117519680 /NCGR_PEP_ID=MMETSP0784-20121206/32774_1 /TAXON_ID=39447 /ORGANISM="" /LENGTH=342 /DNA_ID=CAMNT_0005315643 /DNA_START=121 /DNA_END=1150 /DNA_ORIENTATION=-